MKMKSVILAIALTVAASLDCIGFQTKEEFNKYLKEKIYGYWDLANDKDERIKRDVVPKVNFLIDERNALLKERNALLKERNDREKEGDGRDAINQNVSLVKERDELVRERDALAVELSSLRRRMGIAVTCIVAVFAVGLLLGRNSLRLASFARSLIPRKSKDKKCTSHNLLHINPNKCPQCGTIRPDGQYKCPNPKCGIRF